MPSKDRFFKTTKKARLLALKREAWSQTRNISGQEVEELISAGAQNMIHALIYKPV